MSCLVWHQSDQCWNIMMQHKETVMSRLCTHVCLRPHTTTNYSNLCSSSSIIISLTLLYTALKFLAENAHLFVVSGYLSSYSSSNSSAQFHSTIADLHMKLPAVGRQWLQPAKPTSWTSLVYIWAGADIYMNKWVIIGVFNLDLSCYTEVLIKFKIITLIKFKT